MLRILIATSALALAAPAFAQEAAPAPSTAPAPAPTAPPDVASIVQSDWPLYDKGAKGYLTEAEFSTWIGALKANSGAVEDPATAAKWLSDAFKLTDTDGNAQVTQPELVAFLQSKTKPR